MRGQADKLAFLKTLEEAGVGFTVHLVDGMFYLEAAEVLRYAEDPDQFAAEKRGVPCRVYPCHGITR